MTDIIPRDEWGARPPKTGPTRLTNFDEGWIGHWLGIGYASDKTDEEIMRLVQAFHQDDRGWNDFAYNFAIGRSARIFEGRGWGKRGAHAGTNAVNNRSMAIVFLIGQGETPTPDMYHAAEELLHEGLDRGYDPNQFRPHSDVRSTQCPGPAITRWLKETTMPTPSDFEHHVTAIQGALVAAGIDIGTSGPDNNGIDGDLGPLTVTGTQTLGTATIELRAEVTRLINALKNAPTETTDPVDVTLAAVGESVLDIWDSLGDAHATIEAAIAAKEASQ